MEAITFNVNDKKMSSFVAELLGRGAGLQLRVTGESMAPAIRSGEVVAIEKTPPDALRTGDLILFRNGESLVLHRILFTRRTAAGALVFRTMGDAARSLDEPVHPDQILGRVMEVRKQGPAGKPHSRNMQSFSWKIRNRLTAFRQLSILALSAPSPR